MASNCRSTKKSSPIAIATDRTAMPYWRVVGIGVGEEGSRFAMLASFVSQPTKRRNARRLVTRRAAKSRLRGGQRELKYRTARFIRLRPQPAPMGVDDRPANRQPHPHAAGLRGVKCIEHPLEMQRVDARPGIVHCHKDTCVVLPGAD